MDYGAIDLGKGGSAIPYHAEDGSICREFEQALVREGLASRMEERLYSWKRPASSSTPTGPTA